MDQTAVLLDVCCSYSDVINFKCALCSAQLRKALLPATNDNSSDSAWSKVDLITTVKPVTPNISETAGIMVLAEETMKKAEQNLMKAKLLPGSKVLKSNNKCINTGNKSAGKGSSQIIEKHSSKKVATKSYSSASFSLSSKESKESAVIRVKNELEMLVEKVKPQDPPTVKPLKPDPCPFARPTSGDKQCQLHKEQMSRLFEDCWMLQKHASTERDVGCKAKDQFCSKLLALSTDDSELCSSALAAVLRLAPFVFWLRDCNLSHESLTLLPASDALWILCTVRKLLHLHNQLSESAAFLEITQSLSDFQSIKSNSLTSAAISRSSWIPRSPSLNLINQILLSKYLDMGHCSSALLSQTQCLFAKRVLISLWCQYLACDETKQWSTNFLRGAHNLLCASKLAPSFVILESDGK